VIPSWRKWVLRRIFEAEGLWLGGKKGKWYYSKRQYHLPRQECMNELLRFGDSKQFILPLWKMWTGVIALSSFKILSSLQNVTHYISQASFNIVSFTFMTRLFLGSKNPHSVTCTQEMFQKCMIDIGKESYCHCSFTK
jgi:hypothetical protein